MRLGRGQFKVILGVMLLELNTSYKDAIGVFQIVWFHEELLDKT